MHLAFFLPRFQIDLFDISEMTFENAILIKKKLNTLIIFLLLRTGKTIPYNEINDQRHKYPRSSSAD